MSGPQYRSAWGSDAEPSRVEPQAPVAHSSAGSRASEHVPNPDPAASAPAPTLAAQLAAALAVERHTPWESWEALARRAGFPRSTLDRVRAGQGCTVGTADKLAESFGWTIILTWKE